MLKFDARSLGIVRSSIARSLASERIAGGGIRPISYSKRIFPQESAHS
jgi:hypothetical protein